MENTYCDLSSFGPALFEIWWPDIYLGGPYGSAKDKMYWPELVRQSEKCAGPVLMSRAALGHVPLAPTSSATAVWVSGYRRRQSRCRATNRPKVARVNTA